ncbi:hypothetical protein GGU11DRAFT_138764 [Lentinula aff. detonsa]|nr:hypothetical protein GGU11DRAFT_138764 [Lentinula aff. detonsa]
MSNPCVHFTPTSSRLESTMPPHKKRRLTQADLERNSTSYVNRSAPRQIMSSLSRSGLSTTTRIIGAPSVQQEKPSTIPTEPTATTSLYAEESKLQLNFVEESRTQRAKLRAEYQEFLPTAAKLLMMQEADSRIGQLCSCGHAARRVRCQQCLQQAPLCHSCWLGAHKHQPLHWAEAWDETKGYFVRHDISMLMPESLGIPHYNKPEPKPKAKNLYPTIHHLSSTPSPPPFSAPHPSLRTPAIVPAPAPVHTAVPRDNSPRSILLPSGSGSARLEHSHAPVPPYRSRTTSSGPNTPPNIPAIFTLPIPTIASLPATVTSTAATPLSPASTTSLGDGDEDVDVDPVIGSR